ncbi:glycosyl transferase family 9 [Alkalidesulfovibrio alkalitolerans DSM 16529]|jgi:heptosyltransferase-2|uniref:Glycosyl transferase family 9 n=1 Tax=Alkalidesulfovibrio alkalitolerans DSM 16529 TaxID=1121439 RepID=S7UGU8_9BACT|nr:glycosyltransferase family 9 protein [Alkalidesulfovibrio alkalitolerans]EPR31468.1 glycosyl transferase family 9 [Alkalidesulfovibrio alkalitolerans DSM 16529]
MDSRKTPPTGPFSRIALWQTAFLGDAVLTLPLAATLKRAWPSAEMTFFVRKGLGGLFSAQPEFSRVVEIDKRGADKGIAGAIRLGRMLRGQGFDLMVSAHTSLRSALVALSSGIATRVGYDAPLFNRLAYTRAVPRRFEELDEIERLLGLAEALGLHDHAAWPGLVLPDAALREAEALLHGLSGPLIGLHPGSVWPTKRWPAPHFARLADLCLTAGFTVLLFAGPGEEDTARAVRAAMRGKDSAGLTDFSGRLSLPVLAAVLGRLDAYATNDSGPMHLAWAQKTPVAAFFGPTVRSLGFFPRGRSRVLETPLPCRPCGLHGHKTCPEGHHRCMTDVTPEEAFAVVRDLVEQGREDAR